MIARRTHVPSLEQHSRPDRNSGTRPVPPSQARFSTSAAPLHHLLSPRLMASPQCICCLPPPARAATLIYVLNSTDELAPGTTMNRHKQERYTVPAASLPVCVSKDSNSCARMKKSERPCLVQDSAPGAPPYCTTARSPNGEVGMWPFVHVGSRGVCTRVVPPNDVPPSKGGVRQHL